MQFLTVVTLCLTCGTLVLKRVVDWFAAVVVSGGSGKSSNMDTFSRSSLIHHGLSLATAAETVITLAYWPFRCFLPHLLFIRGTRGIPLFHDLCLHLFPTVALWLEMIRFSPTHAIHCSTDHCAVDHSSSTTAFCFGYLMWAEFCFLQNDYYAYPLLARITLPYKLALTSAVVLLMLLTYRLALKVSRNVSRDAV